MLIHYLSFSLFCNPGSDTKQETSIKFVKQEYPDKVCLKYLTHVVFIDDLTHLK